MNIKCQTLREAQIIEIALRSVIDDFVKDMREPEDVVVLQPFKEAAEALLERYFDGIEDPRRYFLGEDGEIHEQRGN